jgi:hypothetical protein
LVGDRGSHDVRRRSSGKTQFDDLERREPLHAGRAGYQYGFAALNLGLQATLKGFGIFFPTFSQH